MAVRELSEERLWASRRPGRVTGEKVQGGADDTWDGGCEGREMMGRRYSGGTMCSTGV